MPMEIKNRNIGQQVTSRRALLQYSLGAIAAARGTIPETGAAGAAVAMPKRGGTLQVGMSGGGSGDTLNAGHAAENLDFARATQLYDVLVEQDLNESFTFIGGGITPYKDATVWTIRLQKGITFHNGKSLEAEDVRYTMQRIVANNLYGVGRLHPL